MHESQTVSPQPHHTPPPHQPAADYPSSPITTAKQGVQSFWRNGRQAFAGVVVLGAVLVTLATVAAVTAILALLIVVFANITQGNAAGSTAMLDLLTSQLPPETTQLTNSLMGMSGALVGVIIVAGAVALLIGAFMQALGFAYVGLAVVRGQTAPFGEITRLAFKRTLPLLGLAVVMVAAVAVLIALPYAIFGQTPELVFVFGLYMFVLMIAFLIFGMRFVFAPLGVVIENLGPIKALGHSWNITKGRVWEILGVLALTMIVTLVLELIFTPIRNVIMGGSFALLWLLIELTVSTVVGFATLAVLAQRFTQLQKANQTNAQHKVAYGVNIGMLAAAIVLAIAVGSVQAAMRPAPTLDDFNVDDSTYLDSDGNPIDFNDDSYQDLLDEYNLDESQPAEDAPYEPSTTDSPYNYQ